MKIKLQEVPIRDLYEGFVNSDESGCKAFRGLLDIRPPFQREFVYNDKQRDAVIDTVRKGFPLNVMYWVKNKTGYEVLDGQQRTLSICMYIHGDYSINFQYFHNLEKEEKDQILDYKLMIYVCEGEDREKLDWFKTINIAGAKLTDQELRNAVYVGPWLADAKAHFSKTNGPAYNLANKLLSGAANRQDYLETVLDWISNGKIEDYIAKNQLEPNANELWLYFNSVITWVKTVFPNYQKEMKGLAWGRFYNAYKDKKYDSKVLQDDIQTLMMDDDVTKKSGIFEYLLSGKTEEKALSIRAFTESQKRTAYAKSGGICPICGKHFEYNEMEADHITPWHLGGKTVPDNLQMICKHCNRTKSGK